MGQHMRKSILRGLMIVILTLAVSSGIVFAGAYEDGRAAYTRGDRATALKLIKPLAAEGNAAAQALLGFIYANGPNVPWDDEKAIKWYRLAVAQGNGGELAEFWERVSDAVW
jgi:hypothetical protein